MDELNERAHRVLDTNLYLTLGTVGDDGGPWVTPVFFTRVADRFLWVSSPDAVHSRNLEERPEVRAVVFDSSVPVGGASAVWLTGTAARVPDEELAEAAAAYSERLPDGLTYGVPELTGDADVRLYAATATAYDVLVRGSDPDYGTGVDSRCAVDLS